MTDSEATLKYRDAVLASLDEYETEISGFLAQLEGAIASGKTQSEIHALVQHIEIKQQERRHAVGNLLMVFVPRSALPVELREWQKKLPPSKLAPTPREGD